MKSSNLSHQKLLLKLQFFCNRKTTVLLYIACDFVSKFTCICKSFYTFQFFHFKKMTKEAGKTEIKEMKVNKDNLVPLVSRFEDALQQLPNILKV